MQVNFSYFEAGENKQALVKLVTCERWVAFTSYFCFVDYSLSRDIHPVTALIFSWNMVVSNFGYACRAHPLTNSFILSEVNQRSIIHFLVVTYFHVVKWTAILKIWSVSILKLIWTVFIPSPSGSKNWGHWEVRQGFLSYYDSRTYDWWHSKTLLTWFHQEPELHY